MRAITIKSISFRNFNKQLINIPVDTEIYIDLAESIAFYKGMHFYISREEYITMN
jgi:hypothetical protein